VFDHTFDAVIARAFHTLVDGRYKLWSYVNSNTEIMDLGPVAPNAWHIAYLYARQRRKGEVVVGWESGF